MEFIIDLAAERSIVRESIKGIIWTIFFTRLFGPVTPMEQEFLDITYPMASNLPELDSLIDDKISKLLKYIDKTNNNNNNNSNNNNSNNSHTDVSIKHTINVEFYNTKDKNSSGGSTKRKSSGWFGSKQDNDDDHKNQTIINRLTCWEIWFINIEILPINTTTKPSIPQPINTTTYKLSPNIELSMKSFESNLLKIYDIVDQYKDHIPPITSLDSAPFPYEININEEVNLKNKRSSNSNKDLDHDNDDSWGTYIKEDS